MGFDLIFPWPMDQGALSCHLCSLHSAYIVFRPPRCIVPWILILSISLFSNMNNCTLHLWSSDGTMSLVLRPPRSWIYPYHSFPAQCNRCNKVLNLGNNCAVVWAAKFISKLLPYPWNLQKVSMYQLILECLLLYHLFGTFHQYHRCFGNCWRQFGCSR